MFLEEVEVFLVRIEAERLQTFTELINVDDPVVRLAFALQYILDN